MELTREAQRQARVNACSDQTTPDRAVAAWDFFRNYYLASQGRDWYVHGFSPSPVEHYLMVRDLFTYRKNAYGAPRSFAKSVVFGEEIPMLFYLTRRSWITNLFLSAGKFVAPRMDRFLGQLEGNELIIGDFGVQKVPRGGAGMWGHQAIKSPKTKNGIFCYSFEGRVLGLRPHYCNVDDAEFDPSLKIQPTGRTELVEKAIVNIILPMLEKGSMFLLSGTLHRRDFYINHVCTSGDPKYKSWNRRVIEIYDGQGNSIWDTKMDNEWLEEQRAAMGDAAFQANYMNRPGSNEEKILDLHEDLGEYVIEGEVGSQPLESDAVLISSCKTGKGGQDGTPDHKRIVRPFGQTVSRMFRVALVDYAHTVNHMSDYSCVLVCGFENSPQYSDTLWVLDMFLGKVGSDELIKQIWSMSTKWRCQVVGVESVSVQHELADRVAVDFAKWAQGGGIHMPRVFPVKYPNGIDKASRIASTQWRYNQHRILYPKMPKNQWPWNQLYHQTEDFTLDLALLPKDDAIDTLAQAQYVVRPRSNASRTHETPTNSYTPLDSLMVDGDLYDEFGLPALGGLDPSRITNEHMAKLRELGSEDVEEVEREITDTGHLNSIIWLDNGEGGL